MKIEKMNGEHLLDRENYIHPILGNHEGSSECLRDEINAP
jgi:hypothetical protein